MITYQLILRGGISVNHSACISVCSFADSPAINCLYLPRSIECVALPSVYKDSIALINGRRILSYSLRYDSVAACLSVLTPRSNGSLVQCDYRLRKRPIVQCLSLVIAEVVV